MHRHHRTVSSFVSAPAAPKYVKVLIRRLFTQLTQCQSLFCSSRRCPSSSWSRSHHKTFVHSQRVQCGPNINTLSTMNVIVCYLFEIRDQTGVAPDQGGALHTNPSSNPAVDPWCFVLRVSLFGLCLLDCFRSILFQRLASTSKPKEFSMKELARLLFWWKVYSQKPLCEIPTKYSVKDYLCVKCPPNSLWRKTFMWNSHQIFCEGKPLCKMPTK